MDPAAIIKLYENIQEASNNLYIAVKNSVKAGSMPPLTLPADQWKAKYEDGIVKVYIPDYPPVFPPKIAKEVFTNYSDRWINNMVSVLSKLKECPKLCNIFVWIKFFLPTRGWDIDNRDVKPIIDGIRYSGKLIGDDTFNNVSYGCKGEYSIETPHTEVYIISYESINIHDIIW